MKKTLLTITFSTITYFLLLSPFLLPDEWTYIKQCKSEYHPATEVLMYVSIFTIFSFAFGSIYIFYNNLFNKLEE